MYFVAVVALLAAVIVLGGGIGLADATPSIRPIANQTVDESTTLREHVRTWSADGDVTWSIDGPEGARIHPDTGRLVYVPERDHAGPQTLTVTGTDDTGSASMTINVTVGEAIARVISINVDGDKARYGVTPEAQERVSVVVKSLTGNDASVSRSNSVTTNTNQTLYESSWNLPTPAPNTVYYLEVRRLTALGGSLDRNENIYAQFTPGMAGFEIIANPNTRPNPFAPTFDEPVEKDTPETISPRLVGVDGDPPVITTATTDGLKGNVTAFTATSVTYTPHEGAGGADTITYTVADDLGKTATGSINIRLPIPPLAVNDDTFSTPEDTPINLPVLANDTAVDVVLTAHNPEHGNTRKESNNTITYTPPDNYNGPDSFVYTVTRDGESLNATVNITVDPVDDQPTFEVPANDAGEDFIAIDEQKVYRFNASITNPDGVPYVFDIELGDPPATGAAITRQGSFSWEPQEDDGGKTYPITIIMTPTGRETVRQQIMLRVLETNADPVIILPATANTTQLTRFEVPFTISDSDEPAQTLTVDFLSRRSSFGSEIVGDKLVWVPDDREARDTPYIITLVVQDDHDPPGTSMASIAITSAPFAGTVPVIAHYGADPYVIELGIDEYVEPGAIASDNLVGYAGEVTIDTSDIVLNETGTYSVVYSAPADAAGNTPANATRTVIVEDTTKPVIRVTGQNPHTVGIGSTYDDLGATVTDNDPAYAGTAMPSTTAIDTATEANHTVTYTAPADAAGNEPEPVTRTVQVRDLSDDTNEAPTAQDVPFDILEDNGREVITPHIVDDGTAIITAVGSASRGTTDYTPTTVIYTPYDNEHGSDSFNYTVTDDRGLTATGTVTVEIQPVNDVAILTTPTRLFLTEHEPFEIILTATDPDNSTDELTFSNEDSGVLGGHVLTGNRLHWTPGEDWAPIIFTTSIRVFDGIERESKSINLIIAEVNENPAFVNLNTTHTQIVDSTFMLDLNAEDADLDRSREDVRRGNPLSPQPISYQILSHDGPSGAAPVIDSMTGEIAWNMTEIGDHTLRVRAEDNFDPPGRNDTVIIVRSVYNDTAVPVITLREADQNPQIIELGDPYMDLGATVTDDDPSYTTRTATATPDTIDTTIAANHTITYSAPADAAGKTPEPVTRNVTVQDTTKPVINIGRLVQTIDIGSDYTDLNATVTDNDPAYEGTATANQTSINTETEDTYTIEYTAPADAAGNIPDPKIRTVQVRDLTVPNVLPDAPDDMLEVNEGETETIMPAIDDRDGTPSIIDVGSASKGTPRVVNTTTIAYTANDNEEGDDSFTYTVQDDRGDNATGTIDVTIIGINDPPVLTAVPDMPTINELEPYEFDLNATDPDPGDDISTLTFESVNAPAGLGITGNRLSWTPAEEQGPETHTFNITVSDDEGATDSQEVTFTVTEVNTAPVLDPLLDEYAAPPGTELVIDVNANDTDIPEQMLRYEISSARPTGMEINSTDGRITWTPTADDAGRHPITVAVTDAPGLSDSQNLTVIVSTVNRNPSFSEISPPEPVTAGRTLTIPLSAFDPDPGTRLTYTLVEPVPAGASITTGGIFTWETTADQGGRNYTITVMVEDGAGGSDRTTFMVTVRGADTEPNQDPVAPDVQNNARLNALNRITPDVTDPDGDDITITRVTGEMLGTVDQASLASGTILYRPNQTGIDRLTYEVEDGRGGTDSGTINIYINERSNARPALAGIDNTGTTVGTNVNFTANAVDSNGDPLTFEIANVPEGASINGTTGYFGWTPTSSQNGTHIVTIIVHDGRGGASWQDVTITVLRAGEINRPPVPEDITTTAIIGEPKTFQPRIMDPDGDTVTMTLGSPASSGTILDAFVSRGILIYIGTGLGAEEFTYTLSDGRGGTATGTIRLEVLPPANISPTLGLIGDRNINALQELAFNADATDIDSTMLTFGLIGEPAGAQITPQGAFSWTPTEAQEGRHDFTVIVSDDAGGNDTETITVNVRNKDFVNSAPIAPDIVDSTPQNTPGIIRPPISDPNDDPVRITAVTANTKGEIVTGFLRAGIVIYRPNTGQTGIDTINYTVSDGSTQTSTGTITVFINAGGNRNPVLAPIGLRNINAGEQLTFNILARDRDPIFYLLAGAPAGAEISEQGVFSWTPTPADVGNHTFTIAVYDERGGSSSEVVTMRVLPAGTANRNPIAPTVTITVGTGSSTPIAPEIGDPDGDQVSITGATGDGSGTIIPSADSILYLAGTTPGSETITYTVEDIRGAVSTGTITITIQ